MTEQELIESFAGNLDYIMRSEHMNQSELARRSHLSRESICKYLKGQRMPTLKALMNLSYESDSRRNRIIFRIGLHNR